MTVDVQGAPYAGWRAAAATALVAPGATLAHTWAGGHTPPVPALVVLAALVLGASSLVLRRRVPAWVLLPLLAGAQLVLHSAFVAVDTTGHGHHVTGSVASPWTWRMLVAHVAVAVLTAVVWRLCERTAAAVVAATALDPTYAGGRRDPRPAASRGRHLRPLLHLDAAPRRGPPGLPRAA